MGNLRDLSISVFLSELTWLVNICLFSVYFTSQLNVLNGTELVKCRTNFLPWHFFNHRMSSILLFIYFTDTVFVFLLKFPFLSLSPHSQSWHYTSHRAADVGRALHVWVSCVILGGNPGDVVRDIARIDWQPQPLPESNMTEKNLISPPPFTPPFQFHHLLSLSTTSLTLPSSSSCCSLLQVKFLALTTAPLCFHKPHDLDVKFIWLQVF